MSNNFLPVLTPLRGLAALFVVLFHARLILFPQINPEIKLYSAFLENAYLWVDLFFILSGYVMLHCYQQTFSSGITRQNWQRFIWLRFTRIYPLFLITLLCLIAWESYKQQHGIGFFGGALLNSWGLAGIPAFAGPFNTSQTLLSNLLMLQGLSNYGLSWNIAGWSLSIEWLCYLAFPFAVPFLLRLRSKLPLTLLVNAGILISLVSLYGTLDITTGIGALLRGWIGFTTGASLCCYVSLSTRSALANSWLPLLTFIACLIVMHVSQNVWSLLACYPLFAVLVASSATQKHPQHIANRVLDNRLTNWLGDLSYSMYLWHCVLLLAGVEILNLINPLAVDKWYQQTSWLTHLLAISGFLGLLIALSALSYYGFEKPIMKWLRRQPAAQMQAETKRT